MSKMDGELKKCERCSIYVPAKTFPSHLQEKRHRIREKRFTEMMQNSIFISCLPKEISELELTEELRKYGDVRTCSIIPRSNTAIVEFDKRESAEICLRGPIFIQDSLVKIAPRREPKPRAVPLPVQENDVPPEALVSILERARIYGAATTADKLIELAVETVRAQYPERKRKMHILQRDLEACISHMIPNCCALQFGSAVTGLTLKGSDADIVIIGPNDQSQPFPDGPQLVKRVRKLLWGWRRTFGSIVAIPEARIPIVKLLHIPTGIACDISFQGQECVIKSRQLSRVLDLDYRIRPLIIFLKYWEKCHNIINLSRFSSYAATLMVVFFLQQLPVPMLPPINKLIGSAPPKDVLATAQYTYSELAEGFFRFYGETDLINHVICPWLGCLVPCEAICAVSEESLPDDIKRLRRLTMSFKTPLEMGTPIVVQDPYELNRNVTERVKEKDFIFFRLCCTEALDVMKRGNPIFLFKDFCIPSEIDMTTTLRADPFLTLEYLGPTECEDSAAKEILYNRWLKAVLVLVPEFLTKFVRLKVESCDDIVQVPKIPEASTSKCNVIAEQLPRRWNCTGKPLLHSWTARKKIASKLNLSPELTMTERESKISDHLEKETSDVEDVAFTFLIRAGTRKESVRCTCAAYTANGPEFNSMAARILSIIPLWVKAAFECKKTLEYITKLILPTNTKRKHKPLPETRIIDSSAGSFHKEAKIGKKSAIQKNMAIQKQSISTTDQSTSTTEQKIIINEQNIEEIAVVSIQSITTNEKNATANKANVNKSVQNVNASDKNAITDQ